MAVCLVDEHLLRFRFVELHLVILCPIRDCVDCLLDLVVTQVFEDAVNENVVRILNELNDVVYVVIDVGNEKEKESWSEYAALDYAGAHLGPS